ncbi:MAG: DNA-binding NtrC family response regulator [Planctomycetota bacterium]|jgi:DNA-binding NtrC family response regulator
MSSSHKAKTSILVLEPDGLVAQIVVQTLERAGYLVTLAADGITALNLVSEGEILPQVLITDLGQEQASGLNIAEALHGLVPGLRIVVTSSKVYPSLGERSPQKPDYKFLPKPFGPRELLQIVALSGDEA